MDDLVRLQTEARWFMTEWAGEDGFHELTDHNGVQLIENMDHPPRRIKGEPVRFAVVFPASLPAPFVEDLIPPQAIDQPAILCVASSATLHEMICRLRDLTLIPADMCDWVDTETQKPDEPLPEV